MNLKQKIARGQRADIFWSNDEVKRAISEIREDIFTLFEQTKSDQREEREALYRELHGLLALRKRVEKVITSGQRAEKELENGNRDQKRTRE